MPRCILTCMALAMLGTRVKGDDIVFVEHTLLNQKINVATATIPMNSSLPVSTDGQVIYFNLSVLEDAGKKLFSQAPLFEKAEKTDLVSLAKKAGYDVQARQEFFRMAGNIAYWEGMKPLYTQLKNRDGKVQEWIRMVKPMLASVEMPSVAIHQKKFRDWKKYFIPVLGKYGTGLAKQYAEQVRQNKILGILYQATRESGPMDEANCALSSILGWLSRRRPITDLTNPYVEAGWWFLHEFDARLPGNEYEGIARLVRTSECERKTLFREIAKDAYAITW